MRSVDSCRVSWDGSRYLRVSDPNRGGCVVELDVPRLLALLALPDDQAAWVSNESRRLFNTAMTHDRQIRSADARHEKLAARVAEIERWLELGWWGWLRAKVRGEA